MDQVPRISTKIINRNRVEIKWKKKLRNKERIIEGKKLK